MGDGCGETALAGALAGLREIDDKAALAYALNQFALIRLDRSDFEPAARLAAEALAVARALRRSTEIVVASAVLARAAAGCGDRRAAAAHLAGLNAASGPLSARARLHLGRAAELTGLMIPTLAPAG